MVAARPARFANRSRGWLAALSALALLGCGRRSAPAAPAKSDEARKESVTIMLPQFREDDYDGARAEAMRRGVPLFVDVWAAWCHSCMSMKAYVLRDPALSRVADSFVWLSIDSERRSSAAFLERFKSKSIPTLWVIDPGTEQARLKWVGAATVPELLALLDDARAADPGGQQGEDPARAALTSLRVQADRASAAGDVTRAIELYRSALDRSDPSWPGRARVVEALSTRLSETRADADNVALAARETKTLPKGTSLVNTLINGVSAGARLAQDAKERAALPELLERAEALASDPTLPVLTDDRSGLYETLVDALATEDPARARRLAADWAALLEREAARAPDAAARRVWDPHRLDAYLALKMPQRALPMLEQSERELPQDYNAPARLARAQLALGHIELARAAIERALPRCEGPRKLRLYLLKADILTASGDRAGARSSLSEALDFAKGLTPPARYEPVRKQIEQRIAELT